MRKLFIVDDDSDDLEFLLVSTIEYPNLEVYTFSNAKDFEDVIIKDEIVPDIIILDLHLRIKNGYEILEDFKKSLKLKHVPVYILTGSPLEKEQCLKAGCNGFFVKPNEIVEYKLILDEVLK